MIPQPQPLIRGILQADQFRQQLSYSLHQETLGSTPITIAKHAQVYNCGDSDGLLYFIESGQVKLLMLSPEDRECLLAIHTTGDVFGEMCLSGAGTRMETATAMEETVLKQIPGRQFFARLCRDSLFLVGFVQYLAVRIADQQQVITNLTTEDSEQRLGKTLLRLAKTLGIKTPDNTCIPLRITHEELSEMVGTTRPRISVFMQRFKALGLIDTDVDRF
ncbi:MAG: Crp/Fnr family transcriptional regulator, partial [Acidobacteriota bacterium]